MTKYIFVTGGVVSSLGKGIASASLGKLLESRGLKVGVIKCDPYLNVDPGTMNPYQHGEVYVTQDGAETDLDLGHYERFLSTPITQINNVTAGKIYNAVISKERKGEYLGATVQVIPHVTDEIKRALRNVSNKKSLDVVICEIGGTVGDIESLPFLEAIRQFRQEIGRDNAIDIHLTLVPYISTASELKTKPTQHSVGKLREIGIQPDILICRTEKPLPQDLRKKISLFCNVQHEQVIPCRDVDDIYQVPIALQKEGLDDLVVDLLKIKCKVSDLSGWKDNVIDKLKNPQQKACIAVVGKYTELQDAYKSIYEALKHGGIANEASLEIIKVDAGSLMDNNPNELLSKADGILIPGGFGDRGLEGKLKAAQYARENKVPYFGICLGMQCAVIEFSRNVCGMNKANSTEISSKTTYPVITVLEDQKKVVDKGGTMRLGAYPCNLKKDTKAYKAYRKDKVSERHRHRYEFNNKYKVKLQKHGMVISGVSPNGRLVEMVEILDHPWFVGCQFHPEFQSKPDHPHPLFRDFIKAALKKRKSHNIMAKVSVGKSVSFGKFKIGQNQPLMVVAGPCVIESEKSAYNHAKALKKITKEVGIPFVFKASYDKANRTSVKSFRGLGIDKGLDVLKSIKKDLNISVLSDVHTPQEISKVASVLDVIQIPAFLCRQTDLLVEAGKTNRVINIKKGQFLAPEDMVYAVNKVASTGNKKIVLTERGVSFGYRTLVSDFRSIILMRELGYPVIYDATHSVQRPGGLGGKSGGDRRFAPALAQAATVVGADGIFMEVHQNPDKALSDGPNSIPLKDVPALLKKLKKISKVSCRDD